MGGVIKQKKHLEFMNPGRSPNGDGLGGGIETGPGRSTAPSSSPFGSFTTSPSASTRCSAAPPAPRMESPHRHIAPQTIPALRYFGFRRFWVFFCFGRETQSMSPLVSRNVTRPRASLLQSSSPKSRHIIFKGIPPRHSQRSLLPFQPLRIPFCLCWIHVLTGAARHPLQGVRTHALRTGMVGGALRFPAHLVSYIRKS